MTSDLNPQRHLANHIDDPDIIRRAQSNLARTARDGGWSRDELVQVMEALGWADYKPGGRRSNLGERQSVRNRRKPAQDQPW